MASKKGYSRRIDIEEIDSIIKKLEQNMIEDMKKYDVVFHDVYPPDIVPASKILADLEDKYGDLSILVRRVREREIDIDAIMDEMHNPRIEIRFPAQSTYD